MLTPRRAKILFLILILATGLLAILSSPAPNLIPKVEAAALTVLLNGANPVHAHVGQVVTFTATGATASDGTACSVSGAPASVVQNVLGEVSHATTTGYGAFTIGPGPANTGGSGYTLTVTCGPDSGTATLIIDPFMTVTPSFGFASTKVVVTVNGFPSDAAAPCTLSGAVLEVYSNPSNPLNPTCTLSGSSGTVSGSFVANTGFPGLNTVTVNVVGGFASAGFTEVVAPTAFMALSHAPANYGTIGAPIVFTGGGFKLGSSRGCTLTDSAPPLFSVSSPPCSINGNGTLTGSFAINPGAAGAGHIISVLDPSGPPCSPACTPFTTTFTVDPSPTTLGISAPQHGVAGSFFTISGPAVSFAGGGTGDAGSCNAIFSNPSSPVLLASQFCVVDNAGNILLASFRVAGTAPRDVIYTLQITPKQGDTSGLSVTTFHSDPAISVSPTSGSPATGPFPATTVTISGTGFASTDTQPVCQGNAATTAPAGMTVSNYVCSSISGGILSATFQVGAGSLDKGGAFFYSVAVNPSAAAGDLATATASFGVAPQIFVSPSSGVGGNSILGGGAGFSGAFPPCPVYVSSPGGLFASSPAASCSISATGVATFAFTVDPASLNGAYTITVGNGTAHDTASFSPFTRGTVTTGNVFLSPNTGGEGTTVVVTGTSFSTSDNGCTITSLPVLPVASPVACTIASGNVNGLFFINAPPPPGLSLIKVTGQIGGVNNDFGVAYFSVPFLVISTVTSTSSSTTLTSTSFSTLTTTTNFFSTLTTTTMSTTARSTETDIAYTYLTVTGQTTNFLTMLATATSTSTFISTTMVTTTVASSTLTQTVSGFVVRAQQSLGTPDGLGVLALLLLFVPMVVRRFYD